MRDYAGSPNNLALSCSKLRAKDVRAKAICKHLVLVSGWWSVVKFACMPLVVIIVAYPYCLLYSYFSIQLSFGSLLFPKWPLKLRARGNLADPRYSRKIAVFGVCDDLEFFWIRACFWFNFWRAALQYLASRGLKHSKRSLFKTRTKRDSWEKGDLTAIVAMLEFFRHIHKEIEFFFTDVLTTILQDQFDTSHAVSQLKFVPIKYRASRCCC